MPRLIRRTPLSERVKAYLDPYDFLLWLAEEINDDAYDDLLKAWATPIGLGLNFAFVLARGASISGQSRRSDDVFGDVDSRTGSGWLAWFSTFLVHSLTLLCCFNAFFTFFRKRNYRLFEQPIDTAPATPSAYRVKVDSSPMASSPLRYLRSIVSSATASGRAYPDAEREVWELGVWDPKPFNLTVFTLFSPGHVLLYFALLPPAAMDPRPSVTVLRAVGFAALLSLQLVLLKTSFSQQAKDVSLVHGEVMNEYDTKFVRPSLNRPVRDVGIQTCEGPTSPQSTRMREVDVYTPTTIVNRGFRTNPNPNYASQYDPYNLSSSQEGPARQQPAPLGRTPSATTPMNGLTPSHFRPLTASSAAGPDFSSPLKPHHERLRERSPQKGDGGSMGVYSHPASPLRKTASANHLRPNGVSGTSGSGRPSSPLKRLSTPGTGRLFDSAQARRRETGRL